MIPEKNPTTGVILDVFGPTLEYLVSPSDENSDFCVMKGIIPMDTGTPLQKRMLLLVST